MYRSLFLSFRKRLFYVKIKGGRKMGATGVASQRKTIEESIERNKEKYIETSHDIHANPEI
ncbi:amidohydrolase, partial [Bacillus cereus]|nr:amidohydrolase [Bacillus cereus]